MKSILQIAAVTALGLFSQPVCAAEHPDTTGWQDLFSKDLTTSAAPGQWVFADGVLVAKNHETLWTKDSYSSFILDVEFKVEKASNSGIFLRSSDTSNVLKALEIQVHESTDGTPFGMVGAIYDCAAPSKSMAKPVGEWNRMTITCKDNLVTVIFNGEMVIDADLNQWKEAKKNPDGTPNKFAVALKDYARVGPIGLQGLHGKAMAPVYYRNLKIKVLD